MSGMHEAMEKQVWKLAVVLADEIPRIADALEKLALAVEKTTWPKHEENE